jgi:inner membrane protein involved in colicin E2 resistance
VDRFCITRTVVRAHDYCMAGVDPGGLSGVYLAGALGARKLGIQSGAGIGVPYAILYEVLISEDK